MIPHQPLKPIENQIQSMQLFETDQSEVIEIIYSSDNKTSSGQDEIGNVLVKTTGQNVAPLLTYFIHLSFKKGKFPGELIRQKFYLFIKKVIKLMKTTIDRYLY